MSSGWVQQAKKTKKSHGPLADWCDANLSPRFARRVAALVAKGDATPRVVDILKEFRGKNKVLSSAQRIAVEAQLDGAGPWSSSEASLRTAAPPRHRAPAVGPAVGQRRGADRTSGMALKAAHAEIAALKAAALPGPTEGQPSRRARRAARRVNGTGAEPAAMPVDADGDLPTPAGWQCARCERPHPQTARQCRVCATKKVTTSAGTAGQAARSEAQTAADAAEVQNLIDRLAGCGLSQTKSTLTVMAELRARLEGMTASPAPAPVLDDTARLGAAQSAVDSTEAVVLKFTDRIDAMNSRLSELQLDLEALQRVRADALQQQMEAEKALAVVQQEVGSRAAAPGHAVVAEPAAQGTDSLSAHRAKTHAAFAGRLAALNDPDSLVQIQIRSQLEEAGGPDHTAVVAKMCAMLITTVLQELAEDAPTTASTASAVPAAPLKAQPAKHVSAAATSGVGGNAQLPARQPVKLAAQAQASATQVAKQGVAKLQRVELRRQMVENRKGTEAELKVQADELAALDAEDLADLSDNDSCK